MEGLESKDVLDVKAGAKPDGGEVGSDGGGLNQIAKDTKKKPK